MWGDIGKLIIRKHKKSINIKILIIDNFNQNINKMHKNWHPRCYPSIS